MRWPRRRPEPPEPAETVSASIQRLEVLTDRLQATAGALEALLDSMRNEDEVAT